MPPQKNSYASNARLNISRNNNNANTAEPVNLNSPNLNIGVGNRGTEMIPMWMQPGVSPSNMNMFRKTRAGNLEVSRDVTPPETPKFTLRMPFAIGKGAVSGGRRRRRAVVSRTRKAVGRRRSRAQAK